MATHDYIISNASGAAVRADLNNALAAIATNNSSATAPATTYAYQWWADTGSSPTVMKLRNAANSAWITLFQLDGEWTSLALENGTSAAPSIYFKDSGTDTGIYSPGADQVSIATGGTERMRIRNNGWILFGQSVEDSDSVNGVGIFTSGLLYSTTSSSEAASFNRLGSDGVLVLMKKGGALVGSIAVTSSATAFNTSSDYRLKENIIPVPDAISRLQQLKPSRFNFKADPDRTVDGFIAHEAQAVVPECVTGEKDAVDDDGNPVYQGIDQSKIVPLLTAALQEAIAKIETLEARLTAAGIE